MKNGKIMMNVAYSSQLVRNILISSGIEIFGFCEMDENTPLIDCRARARIPNGARTIISCAFPYLVKSENKRNLSYYACVRDYHEVLLTYLENACSKLAEYFDFSFVPFADNSPIYEVETAVRAGLGVRGDNGLLINDKYGSFVFLGEIVSDMEISVDTQQINGSECLHCGLCGRICPAQSIKNGKINQQTCLSDISQRKGELSPTQENLLKSSGIAWGCDACQLCCPLNKKAEETNIGEFISSAKHYICSDEVSEIIEDRAFNWRGKKVIKRNLSILEG